MTLPRYEAPLIEIEDKPEYEIPFIATIGATAQGTTVISGLSKPYKILEARMYFPDDAVNNVLIYWLIARDGEGSTTGIPTGDNMFSPFATLQWFIGHADLVTIRGNIDITVLDTGLKMHVINNNAYAITMMSILKIREL